MIKRKLFYIMLILLISNCKKTNETNLQGRLLGNWGISSLIYKGQNLTKYLDTNIISLRCEYDCYVPGVIGLFDRNRESKWEIITNNNTNELKITSRNLVFNGRYRLVYSNYKTSENYNIKLDSDDAKIELYKVSELDCH